MGKEVGGRICVPLEWMKIRKMFQKLKGLSDSRSGAVFGEWDYNEGLKFGNFRYFMCRSKCFGPNKTNFINL